ncbi:hypothetical protein [Nostoc sp. PCC 7120 = FACHB-418]|uniref:hypothetical protein n=1 Tax=Nostoc sp. (strain PCC 7120 / SAG 25.82 / UTEX 2576) TaxID=103690 RepID=UPI00000CE331|nr:hypothetical protein [Nostoc sp. PCC 7120 = FACHB-418]BAB73849.1 asl2150 [Nostoc sp. PCC 7120 = FACHB-418]
MGLMPVCGLCNLVWELPPPATATSRFFYSKFCATINNISYLRYIAGWGTEYWSDR